MKPLQITTLAIAIIAFLLAAFFRPSSTKGVGGQEGLGQEVLTRGTLRAGIINASPISELDPTSDVANGYMVDVLRAIARKSDFDIEYVPISWEAMTTALDTRQVDIVVGPIFFTEARARNFAFSDPLFAYAVVIVTPTKSQMLRTINDLKKPGLRVAVGRGGFDEEFVSRFMPEATQSVFPPGDASIPGLEVLARRADLAFMDWQTATKFVAEHPEVEIRFPEDPVSIQYAGYMFRGSDLKLRAFWNLALRNLDLSGELREIDASYRDNVSWYGRVSNRPTIIKE